MKSLLYMSIIIKSSPLGAGVFKKNIAQVKVLRNCGNSVLFGYFDNPETYVLDDETGRIYTIDVKGLRGHQKSKKIFDVIYQTVENEGIAVLYSRWETYSLQTVRFYKKLKTIGVKTLLEIPTYPLNQRWTTIKNDLYQGKVFIAARRTYNAMIDLIGIKKMKVAIDRIVNNNGFDVIWGIPVISITNGVDVESIMPIEHINYNTCTVNLFSVASVANWHGFDRVIAGMYEYYSSFSEKDTYIHYYIVGDGTELPLLKKLVSKYKLEQYVHFIGPLCGDRLDAAFDKYAGIGISVLGTHRCNMKTCDSLKSREYCARCLPFVTTSKEAIYKNKTFALLVDDNDLPIDMQTILEFEFIQKKDPSLVAAMREFSRVNCDWSVAFKNVVAYIEGVL